MNGRGKEETDRKAEEGRGSEKSNDKKEQIVILKSTTRNEVVGSGMKVGGNDYP